MWDETFSPTSKQVLRSSRNKIYNCWRMHLRSGKKGNASLLYYYKFHDLLLNIAIVQLQLFLSKVHKLAWIFPPREGCNVVWTKSGNKQIKMITLSFTQYPISLRMTDTNCLPRTRSLIPLNLQMTTTTTKILLANSCGNWLWCINFKYDINSEQFFAATLYVEMFSLTTESTRGQGWKRQHTMKFIRGNIEIAGVNGSILCRTTSRDFHNL